MVSSEHFLISLKISCVKFASKGDFDSIEIRKSLDIARVFRLPQLFPLHGGGGLGGDVVADAVDVLDLTHDAAGDLIQQLVG